jgi:hypothetical protein
MKPFTSPPCEQRNFLGGVDANFHDRHLWGYSRCSDEKKVSVDLHELEIVLDGLVSRAEAGRRSETLNITWKRRGKSTLVQEFQFRSLLGFFRNIWGVALYYSYYISPGEWDGINFIARQIFLIRVDPIAVLPLIFFKLWCQYGVYRRIVKYKDYESYHKKTEMKNWGGKVSSHSHPVL